MGMSDYSKNIRSAIGSDLMFVPCVAGIIRNDKGEILFQNKGNGEKWSLPAGAIELGEAPAKAIVREVYEETGLNVIPKTLLGVFGGEAYRYQYPNGHQVEYNVFMFDCEVRGGTLEPIDGETFELKYFTVEEMPKLALPYPRSVFELPTSKETIFQWEEDWLHQMKK